MEHTLFTSKLQDIIKHRNIFMITTVGLLLIILLQSIVLFKTIGNTKVILVPMPLKQIGWVDKYHVSDSYLVEMTRYYAYLFLDTSPHENKDKMAEILKFVAPKYHNSLESQLIKQNAIIDKQHISTWFSPEKIKVSQTSLSAEISGTLHVYVGKEETDSHEVTYSVHYVYRNGSLLIAAFNEVKNET